MTPWKRVGAFAGLLSLLAWGIYAGATVSTSSGSEARSQGASASNTLQVSAPSREWLRHPVTYAMAVVRDTLPSYCPFGATASGGGYYLVHVNHPDSVKSQHTRLDQAILSAADAETTDPSDSVWISHDFELRVECDVSAVDSVSVTPESAEIFVGDSLQLTALVWSGGEIIGCSGDCGTYREARRIDWRLAMTIQDDEGE